MSSATGSGCSWSTRPTRSKRSSWRRSASGSPSSTCSGCGCRALASPSGRRTRTGPRGPSRQPPPYVWRRGSSSARRTPCAGPAVSGTRGRSAGRGTGRRWRATSGVWPETWPRTPGSWVRVENSDGLSFKPVFVRRYAHRLLWGHAARFVLMSATIIDPEQFARDLGLQPHEWEWLELPSSFPKQNRPVFYRPAGSMAFRHRDETLPRMIAALDAILDDYPERVLVHTHTYGIARQVVARRNTVGQREAQRAASDRRARADQKRQPAAEATARKTGAQHRAAPTTRSGAGAAAAPVGRHGEIAPDRRVRDQQRAVERAAARARPGRGASSGAAAHRRARRSWSLTRWPHARCCGGSRSSSGAGRRDSGSVRLVRAVGGARDGADRTYRGATVPQAGHRSRT